jgi:WD40 repeat protein
MDRSIRVWSLSDGKCAGVINSAGDRGGHTEPVSCLEKFSLEPEEYVASGSADTYLKLWSSVGALLYSEPQGAIVTALRASQDKSGDSFRLIFSIHV